MTKPIIPWIGGKRRLADQIIPMFPEHTCYVEPFAGAAALYFIKEPSKVEVINDINGDLVNLYRVLKHHLVEFVNQFKWALSSRQIYEWEKMKHSETLTDIQRAARFFYLQKLAFGGRVKGRTFGTATNHTTSTESTPYRRRSECSPSQIIQGLHRTPGLANLYKKIRPGTYTLLYGPTLLRHRRL